MRPIAHQAKAFESTPDANEDLKSLPLPELQAKLGSSPDGLSQVEAQKRLAQYGPNEIEEKKTNPFLKFLTYFWGPIPWMIEAAVNPAVEKAINEFAVRGFRSLGVARSDAQGQWQFLGVLPLFEPPRDDSKATIAIARQMGVNVKMVTGDQLAIARQGAGRSPAPARERGVTRNVLTSRMIR
jgi:P-type E1-E2 ATPase